MSYKPCKNCGSIGGNVGCDTCGKHLRPLYRDMWAVIFPDGRIITGTDLDDEQTAWTIALGWPHPSEIEEAKKRGAFCTRAKLRFYPPRPYGCDWCQPDVLRSD